MRRVVVVSLIGALLTGWPGPAVADWVNGPIRVMRPGGAVFRIQPPSVDSWWRDHRRSRCVSCRGPRRAAQLLYRVETALGARRAVPRYLILPEKLETEWSRAWLFYPSTDSTPAYVVQRGGVGASEKDLRWDVWYRATPHMEEMILEDSGASAPTVGGAVTDTRPSPSRLPWVPVVAILAALALSAILLKSGGNRTRRFRR